MSTILYQLIAVTFDAALEMHKPENIVEIFHLFALISCPNKHGNENVQYIIVSIATLQA